MRLTCGAGRKTGAGARWPDSAASMIPVLRVVRMQVRVRFSIVSPHRVSGETPPGYRFKGGKPPLNSGFPCVSCDMQKIRPKDGRARRRTVVFVALQKRGDRVPVNRGHCLLPTGTGRSTPPEPRLTRFRTVYVQHHSQTAPTAFVLPSRTTFRYRDKCLPGRGKLSGSCQRCVNHATIEGPPTRSTNPELRAVSRQRTVARCAGQDFLANLRYPANLRSTAQRIAAPRETILRLNHSAEMSPHFCRHCPTSVAKFASILR